ncbi:MAG TPA: hypothetical protein VEC99_07160 [Clostridia bacterium]|nr:hypothetical protein [Clostridia bacterium]
MDAKQMSEQAGQQAQEWKQTAQETKEAAQEWGEKAKSTARDAGAAADLYLHEYAWTTLALVAVCAGLFGFFLGRQRS